MTMGLFALVGTLASGFLTDCLGLITVLYIQAAGYILSGILVLALLPRAQATPSIQAEPALDELTSVPSEM